MNVGFIGVGYMGYGIAKNILTKGNNLFVIANKKRAPIDKIVSDGAKEVKTYDELCEKFDYIGTNYDWSEEEYKSVLSNKNLYWEYRHALKHIPRYKKQVKKSEFNPLVKDRLDDLLIMKRNFERHFV